MENLQEVNATPCHRTAILKVSVRVMDGDGVTMDVGHRQQHVGMAQTQIGVVMVCVIQVREVSHVLKIVDILIHVQIMDLIQEILQ